MIKVYAFEPEAILNPVLSNALEQFGFHHGRIIGAVPREWGEKVKEIWEIKPQRQSAGSSLRTA